MIAAEAVGDDLGSAVFAQDHSVMAHRLVPWRRHSPVVTVESNRRCVADEIIVDQGAAREDKIAVAKLFEYRLIRLTLGKQRQDVIFVGDQAGRGEPHPGKSTECCRLPRGAILAWSGVEEKKAAHHECAPPQCTKSAAKISE